MSEHPTDFVGSIEDAITASVQQRIPDAVVAVSGGGGHYRIDVVSAVFAGKSMLENQRLRFPDAYRLVTLGIGLDGVSVPSRESFRLDRSRLGLGVAAGSTHRVIDLTALEPAGRGARVR